MANARRRVMERERGGWLFEERGSEPRGVGYYSARKWNWNYNKKENKYKSS